MGRGNSSAWDSGREPPCGPRFWQEPPSVPHQAVADRSDPSERADRGSAHAGSARVHMVAELVHLPLQRLVEGFLVWTRFEAKLGLRLRRARRPPKGSAANLVAAGGGGRGRAPP